MNPLAAAASCLAVSLCSVIAVGCAAPAEDEPSAGLVDEADLKVSQSVASKTYEGSFVVRGASYGVKVTYTYPASAISSQTLRATNFHRTVGFCDAFMESLPLTARTTVTDAKGAVVADETRSIEAQPTTQFHADRATRCGNGLFAQAAAVPSLPAFISSPGLVLTLEGEAVQLPRGGYTPAGNFGVEATASFRALTPVRSERKMRSDWNPERGAMVANNSETLTVDRGVVTLALPAEMRTWIGVGIGQGGFSANFEELVLRAR